jgi:hypothetical protein
MSFKRLVCGTVTSLDPPTMTHRPWFRYEGAHPHLGIIFGVEPRVTPPWSFLLAPDRPGIDASMVSGKSGVQGWHS